MSEQTNAVRKAKESDNLEQLQTTTEALAAYIQTLGGQMYQNTSASAGEGEANPGAALADLLAMDEEGQLHFAREGKSGGPLRITQVALGDELLGTHPRP